MNIPQSQTRLHPEKRLRIRIDLGQKPSGQNLSSSPAPSTAPPRPDPKTIDIKTGTSVHSFRYWKTKWTNKKTQRAYFSYVLSGYGGRREKRASFKALRARAQELAIALANGETTRLQLTPADQASYLRSRELIAPFRKALESVVSEHADCLKLLAGRASVIDAVRDYLARHPAEVTPKNIPEIITKFFQKRQMGVKWARVLKQMLDRFGTSFPGPLTSVTAPALDDWLDGLKSKKGKPIGLRSRRNYHGAVLALVIFGKSQGYAPKDWNIFADISNPEPKPITINIYTPRALIALLNFAESYEAGQKLVPFITITAFAGVRHGEMNEEKIEHLDWKSIRFRTKRIVVGREEAKTNRARIVDMPDNLIAWLQPYARASGRICALRNTSNALCRLREKAAASLMAESKKVANSTRAAELRDIAEELRGPKKNALRKSFISYKKALTGDIAHVADQAGNSAKVIRENYLHVDEEMKEDAEAWFAIRPTRADVLPLFSWGAQA